MSAARIDLCEVSPITQRSASTRLDLPQPFGPTTPVRPCSMWKSVGSTKDLKPSRRSLLSFITFPRTCGGRTEPPLAGDPQAASQANRMPPESRRRMNRRSAPPQQGNFASRPVRNSVEKRQLFEVAAAISFSSLLDRGAALLHLAVDEQVGVDSTLYSLLPRSRIADDVVVELLIRQALLEALLREAGLLGDLLQHRERLAHRPFVLAVRTARRSAPWPFSPPAQRASMEAATASSSSGNSRKMKRTLPVSMYLRLQRRIGRLVEGGAVRAGHRGVFDDRDRRIGLAEHEVGQRARPHQLFARRALGEGDGGEPSKAAAATSAPVDTTNSRRVISTGVPLRSMGQIWPSR